jgi:hypothetical protein
MVLSPTRVVVCACIRARVFANVSPTALVGVRLLTRTHLALQEFCAARARVANTGARLRVALSAKDQFLRYIFHEMRVPLNAVSLAVEELGARSESMDCAVKDLLDIAAFQVRSRVRMCDTHVCGRERANGPCAGQGCSACALAILASDRLPCSAWQECLPEPRPSAAVRLSASFAQTPADPNCPRNHRRHAVLRQAGGARAAESLENARRRLFAHSAPHGDRRARSSWKFSPSRCSKC